ncbi:hypothetical protein QFC22_003564 [Naganishia vaughanmartiniae]|uniref:Uncharacterized protein n=1 Tax=Naganishia vaughanmartiniae TaxID=1424756 RepID=A0ACC2X5S7_9TREE|nr:hypothetical protein QFC22_003564 [Naganishia vaughanmartiniae]
MSFQLYLLPNPRRLALVADTTALVFRRAGEPDARAEIELVPVEDVDLASMVKVNRGRSVLGVLGLLSIPVGATNEIFLLIASAAISLPPLLPGTSFTPSKLLNVEFHCLSSHLWDDPSIVPALPAADTGVFDDMDLDRDQSAYLASQPPLGHPCDGMKRILEAGTFYYATHGTWDISRALSSWDWRALRDGQQADPATVLDSYDERFVWNSNILAPLLHFRSHLSPAWRTHLDNLHMLVPVIQGFTNSIPVIQPRAAQPLHLALISRLGWKRAGARFKTRGVDDQGNVANFVETETVVSTPESCMSFVQVRGSVPLFWEQQGSQAFGHKLQITRPQAASQPAFDKHFLDLIAHYGSIHAVNLLGGGENEQFLSEAYNKHLINLVRTLEDAQDDEDGKGQPEVTLTAYDFHAMVRAGGHDLVKRDFEGRLQPVREAKERFGWTVVDRTRGELVETQKGVFRTNVSFGKGTNYVEDVISSNMTVTFINQLSSPESTISLPIVLAAHRELWADNGDALSRIYAGTGALNTSVTRSGGKRGWGALISDASKSLGRAYQATFADQDKQMSIDLFLVRLACFFIVVTSESTLKFGVQGIMAGQKPVQVYDPISDAIQDQLKARLPEYSSSKKVRIFCGTWNLNGKPLSGNFGLWLFPEGEYRTSLGELVLILLFDQIKRPPSIGYILHLVPGTSSTQRSTDSTDRPRSATTVRRVTFQSVRAAMRGGPPDILVLRFGQCMKWCEPVKYSWATLQNYRIDLTNEEVRERIEENDLQPLWEADQLRNAMIYKDAFEGYQEGKIGFAPTYKFDLGSDIYDTSEKQRIPAWTDRILYKGEDLYQTSYDIAQVRASDHRPVYATFTTEVHIVDHKKEEQIRSVLKKQVLTREHGSDKGARPPPVPPASRKPKSITPVEKAFRDLHVGTAEQRAIPPPRPAKSVNSLTGKGSPSPVCSSVEDGYIKIRHHPTGSTNASSTSLHTMSPLSGSMQNVAALAASNGGLTGSSPLRRVPPALPALPGRPVAGRAARSTLDVVDEKSKLSSQGVLEKKPTEAPEQKPSTVGSGVARLIAEANRRAMSAGVPVETSVQSPTSTALASPPKEPPLTCSVPALPVRPITPVNGGGINSSAPDLRSVVSKTHGATPSLPRQPARKGSLNATTRKIPTLSEAGGTSAGNAVRSMSVDSAGHVRRMPPPLNESAVKDETKSSEESKDGHAVDMNGIGGAKKKARPVVPPKPVHL